MLLKYKAEWEQCPLCFLSFLGEVAQHERQDRVGGISPLLFRQDNNGFCLINSG